MEIYCAAHAVALCMPIRHRAAECQWQAVWQGVGTGRAVRCAGGTLSIVFRCSIAFSSTRAALLLPLAHKFVFVFYFAQPCRIVKTKNTQKKTTKKNPLCNCLGQMSSSSRQLHRYFINMFIHIGLVIHQQQLVACLLAPSQCN